jgi:ribonuclease T2
VPRPALRKPRGLLALAFLLSLAAPAAAGERNAAPGDFDFYVLSLSWSPSYCAAEEDANAEQCGATRPYSFVVHGLWPQYEQGYPEFCTIDDPGRIRRGTVEAYRDIVPSAGLMGHQWRKHGSCSGLPQADYFALLRQARERISIPAEFAMLSAPKTLSPEDVEERFLTANPGMEEDGIAVTCDRRYLREVRICLTKALAFRACEEVDRRSCPRDRVLMPPAR